MMQQPHQATVVAIGARAVVIEGRPQTGKSSLALALIDRGGVLVGDDSVLLEPRDGLLIASPHPRTRGLIEVRGLGILQFPVCDEAPVSLLVRLDPIAPRFVEGPDHRDLCGIPIPTVTLRPDSPVLAIKVELALERFGLRRG